jgi:hypothetical protein
MLLLTRAEYDYLANSFRKIATLATDGREKVSINAGGRLFEASSKLVLQVVESLSMLGEEYDRKGLTKIPAGRHALRMFESYLRAQLHYLVVSIIPAYDDRITRAAEGRERDRLRIYLTACKSRVTLITELIARMSF